MGLIMVRASVLYLLILLGATVILLGVAIFSLKAFLIASLYAACALPGRRASPVFVSAVVFVRIRIENGGLTRHRGFTLHVLMMFGGLNLRCRLKWAHLF